MNNSTVLSKAYRFLLLEDVKTDAEIVKEVLSSSGIEAEYKVVATELAFKEQFEKWAPDVILADYTLIDFDGLSALKHVRDRNKLIPFIFVTGTLSIEKAVDTLHNGATDFILKDNISTLSKAVVRAIREFKHLKGLEESENRFSVMADSAPAMIWVTDQHNTPVFFNKTMYEYTGIDSKAALKDRWRELLHEEDRQGVEDVIDQGFQERKEFTIEYRYLHKSGEYRWFYTRAIPRTDSLDEFVGYIYSGIDYTDQKRLDDERDSFLGIASHELKTPLTTLKAYNQLMIRMVNEDFTDQETFKKQSKYFLEESEKSIKRMKRLITALLDVSRIQLNQAVYFHEPLNLCNLLEHTVDDFKLDINHHKMVFSCDEDLMVKGDDDKLVQVFSNLIENAIKYSPDGGEVRIKAYRDGDNVVTSIRDFGIGMSDKDINKIFTRFFRSQKDSSKYPGLGIGLYLVSQIVKAHHGLVWVNSQPGEGAEFFVSLPLFLENGKNTNG
ncbi:ATP-binding protein [Roseivirga sp. BDSF3-8]|uniref:ATP-binding protein n=1 Tax=Roseivirga sp. BDSF3-8 TaxID=3241598 RepID=UPI003532090B